jgi:hypothetical protein
MKNNNELIENIRKKLEQQNPCGLVSRMDISRNTGGILHPRTLANLDSLGIGISDPVRIGRKIFYRIDAIVEFIYSKMENTCEKEVA